LNHEKLVSALLKGNAITAERYARDHNKASGELLIRHLQEQEAKTERPGQFAPGVSGDLTCPG